MSQAKIISPTATEVTFSYQAEFQTKLKKPALEEALGHAKYMVGYLKTSGLAQSYNLDPRFTGIGAPYWPPKIKIVRDERHARLRQITYQLSGTLLLEKSVAARLLNAGTLSMPLPADPDTFYDKKCAHLEDDDERADFWYVFDPFRPGCEKLGREPLARMVSMTIAPPPPGPEDVPVGLSELRGDNGNGDLFEITMLDGFSDSPRHLGDEGRQSFLDLNAWLAAQGFHEVTIDPWSRHPLYRYEKDLTQQNGQVIHVRLNHLLAETVLADDDHPRYTKYIVDAMRTSDVFIYNGHSGLGVNMDAKALEKHANEPLVLSPTKKQIFYFNACTSYSYYLDILANRKPPYTAFSMVNGLSSDYKVAVASTISLLEVLLSPQTADLTWLGLLGKMDAAVTTEKDLLAVDGGR